MELDWILLKMQLTKAQRMGKQLRVQDPTGLFLVYHMPVSCSCGSQALQQHLVLIIRKELNYGIIGGTVAVCVAIAVVMFAQISNINTPMIGSSDTFVWNADIPNLILAAKIWKPFSAIFAIIVFAGIYTTAVPLLYNPASRFAKEGTSQFKILTIVLGVLGLIVGLFLPFRVLVNIIYVLNGYVGAVLILFMIYKNIKDLMNKKKAN